MNPPLSEFTLNAAAGAEKQDAVMMATTHLAEGPKVAPVRSRGRVMDLIRTQTKIQTAEQMDLMRTAVVGGRVSAGGVCVTRAGSGQCTENTVRSTISRAHMKGDCCVEVGCKTQIV